MAILRLVQNGLLFTAIVSSIALTGSVLAGYIDPQTFIVPAFLGLAFPFLLLAHLVFCILCIICVRSKYKFLFIIPLLISINTFLCFFGVNFFSKPVPKDEDSFVFMTYNVHSFHDWKDPGISVDSEIFELITKQKPDIICFQDFYSSAKKNNTVDSLKQVLNTQYFYRGPNQKALFPKNALAIFSRFPIVKTGFIYLSDIESGNQCIFADIQKGNKLFRVYVVHLQSLKFQPADYNKWDKGPAHKASFLSDNVRRLQYAFLERSKQVKIMKKETASCTLPYIIAGDFNDSPASYAVNEMSKGLKNSFREKAKGYQVTYDGDMPNFQIDYVLTHPVFKVNTYEVIKKKLSDHFAVRVEIEF